MLLVISLSKNTFLLSLAIVFIMETMLSQSKSLNFQKRGNLNYEHSQSKHFDSSL